MYIDMPKYELSNILLEDEEYYMTKETDPFGNKLMFELDGEQFGIYVPKEDEYYFIDELDKSEAICKFGKKATDWYERKGFLDFENDMEGGSLTNYIRQGFTPEVKAILDKYGEKRILKMEACRKPLSSFTTGIINIISLGEFNKKFANTPYDRLFHLYLNIDIIDDPASRKIISIKLEKNEVINARIGGVKTSDTECQAIQNIPRPLTLNQMMEGAQKIQGNKFFRYSAYNNNCQDFIMALLKGVNAGSEENYAFIKQDTKQLFEGMPKTRKFVNTITDTAALLNTAIKGTGGLTCEGKGLGTIMIPALLGALCLAGSCVVSNALRNQNRIEDEAQIQEAQEINPNRASMYPTTTANRVSPSPSQIPMAEVISREAEGTGIKGEGAGASVQEQPPFTIEDQIKEINAVIALNENVIKKLRKLPRNDPTTAMIPQTLLLISQLTEERDQLIRNLEAPVETTADIVNPPIAEAETTGTGIQKSENYYVQSVVFDKTKFDVKQAREWLKKNNYVVKKPDVTDTQIRMRQVNPTYIKKKGFDKFRTKKIGKKSGISLIIAYK